MRPVGKTEPFRPSNGTIGDAFCADFCAQCVNDIPFGKCDILSRTLIHAVTDLEYPVEWVSDEAGHAWCTAFQGMGDLHIHDPRQAEMTL